MKGQKQLVVRRMQAAGDGKLEGRLWSERWRGVDDDKRRWEKSVLGDLRYINHRPNYLGRGRQLATVGLSRGKGAGNSGDVMLHASESPMLR